MTQLPKYRIVTALVRADDVFLIAKRSKKKRFAPGQWEFPSGFVDKKLSFEKIMLEELDEEFLIRDAVVTKRGEDFVVIDNEGEWIITPFLIDVKYPVAVMHPDEHSALRWVSVEELEEYENLEQWLPDMLKLLEIPGKNN